MTNAPLSGTVAAARPPTAMKATRTARTRFNASSIQGVGLLGECLVAFPSNRSLYASSDAVKEARMLDRSLLMACCAAILTAYQCPTNAVALRPGKATDSTVCDLAPNTTGFLGGSVLIPAAAAKRDQVDAYFRLSGSFVAQKCSDGQILILQGMSDLAAATESLVRLANSACAVSSVVRTEVAIPFLGSSEPGFELRCPISKRALLAEHLGELERLDPMDSLNARLQAAARGEGAQGHVAAPDKKAECEAVTLASLLQGGACKR
jgi:hypothetical protein